MLTYAIVLDLNQSEQLANSTQTISQ